MRVVLQTEERREKGARFDLLSFLFPMWPKNGAHLVNYNLFFQAEEGIFSLIRCKKCKST